MRAVGRSAGQSLKPFPATTSFAGCFSNISLPLSSSSGNHGCKDSRKPPKFCGDGDAGSLHQELLCFAEADMYQGGLRDYRFR